MTPPDSDAREAVQIPERELPADYSRVVLPLPLAQRILGALLNEADGYEPNPRADKLRALAAELRSRLPK